MNFNITLIKAFTLCMSFPVHGEWSEWIDGACSKTCDYGVRKRYRSCEGPYCGGEECTGVEEIEVECNERPCQGVSIIRSQV